MQSRTAEQIDGWPSRPFSGGYGGLHDLAAAEYSGAVSANGAWLFMLNGHAIGVVDGSLDAFDGASGTAYTAPDDSLPLLFAMLEHGGEKRGQYYTERTALSDVDGTLAQGSFTGYVELSENVLSGDYYVVYYGGNAMHCAFVGQAERLLTGDEAANRANDEVGLYDVVAVDISILSIPEPSGGSEAVGVASAASNGTTGDSTAEADPSDGAGGPPIDEPTADESSTSESPDAAGASNDLDLESTLTGGASADQTDSAPEETVPMDDAASPERPESAPDPEESAADPDDLRSPTGDSTDEAVAASLDDIDLDEGPADTDEFDATESDDAPERADEFDDSATPNTDEPEDGVAPPTDPTPPAESTDTRAAISEADESTPTVPPSDVADGTDAADAADTVDAADAAHAADTTEMADTTDEADTVGAAAPEEPAFADPDEETTAGVEAGSADAVDDRPEDVETVEDSESTEFDDLFTKYEDGSDGDFASAAATATAGESTVEGGDADERLAELRSEKQRLAEERDELAGERDRLAARVSELEAEVAASTPPDHFEQVSAQTALEATDLFVRYVSKSAETLDAAHEGAQNQEAVRKNLDLEHHTRFDAERTAVGDQEYGEFLPSTMEYELVTWLVADLLYEIRDTGHTEGLRPLYDALPQIDRADLHGAVDVGDDTVSFDVVCRDRLGNPLLCVDVHESRDPATDAEMDAVLEKSGRLGEVHDEFAGAFLVTSSFFEPSALELATERTASGGLFGGSKRESFVKLSRKRGYHLCLVEARDRRFHLTLPEL
ncbi:hypothetical protein ACFPYI_01105 [Halomarina salina]|uniref:DUF7527 domain-containing protein n=1 Tax=Halomarina salina TaxID=1872699 RepID=A0ABD5RH95_9EURY|nr:hypothetical protein [Halomarina salina]